MSVTRRRLLVVLLFVNSGYTRYHTPGKPTRRLPAASALLPPNRVAKPTASAAAVPPSPMTRGVDMAHARLLLARSYAMAAPSWPTVSKNLPLLGHGRSHHPMYARQDEIKMSSRRWCHGSPDNQAEELDEVGGAGTTAEESSPRAWHRFRQSRIVWAAPSSGCRRLRLRLPIQLAKKSCVPCNSKDIHAMPEDSAKKMLEQVAGWELAAEGDILKLHRAWKVKNFVKGLEFLQLVASVAEEEGHHPDLHLVGWNNVKIDVWTHSVRGLTDNDFILAAKINNLNLEGLLSKKATVQK
uniref:4a-hydroxytetrahydrobiopterin dehydratase n=1 Tax=Oryza meridionalis TaxID=40149 RepID=A0A0E0C5N7_9ORYZ